jgi:DNA polymerase-3 subunit epsilon
MLDTETTGLYFDKDDRMVEIGCIEMIDRVRTGRTFRKLINPEREIPKILTDTVHGITNEMVKNEPKFAEIADELIEFINGAEIIAHNAAFDVGFVNMEFKKAGKQPLHEYTTNTLCTLELDRILYPKEKKHKLDAICDRFSISREHRTLHGALIDCDLTIDVFLKYYELFPEEHIESLVNIKQTIEQTIWERPAIKRYNIALPTIQVSEQDEAAHIALLDALAKKEKLVPIFNKVRSNTLTM